MKADDENTMIEVCEVCGEERERAEFYHSTECREDGEWIQGRFIPGPSQGEHVFVKVSLDDVTRGTWRAMS